MADTPIRPISPAERDAVLLRLRRIEGQVRGIQRMVEEGRDCREVVQQLAAIKAALTSVSAVVLECYAHHCLDCLDDADHTRDQMVAELAALIDMLLKVSR